MELKTCPSCKGSMEKGYIIAPGGMHWNQIIPTGQIHPKRNRRKVPYGKRYNLPSIGESICPSSDARLSWTRTNFPYLESFWCQTCNLFIYLCKSEDEEFASFKEERPKGKVLRCPSCHAQYFYLDSIIAQGIISCQNCLKEFPVVE